MESSISETDKIIADKIVDALFPQTLNGWIELYKQVLDIAFFFMQKESIRQNPKSDRDAHLLYQMTILKCFSIIKLSEGINHYTNPIDGALYASLFDSFSISSIVRPQFEAFCNFNNIYLQSKTQEELDLKYNLWVVSGLKYRQSFNVISEENKKKKEDEKKQLEETQKIIRENSCFKQLDESSKKRIEEAIRQKDWKIKINGTSVELLKWHELLKNAGINSIYQKLYTHLSLSTHPTNVSVFQFGEFGGRADHCILPVQLSCVFMTFLIRDFCIHFPNSQKIFKNLPQHYKYIINTYNSAIRGKNYSLE